MNFCEAQLELRQLLGKVEPSQLPKLLNWVRTSEELDLLQDNNQVILSCIADDIRESLPLDAMLPSEADAKLKLQRWSQFSVHVDAFLYDDEHVDALCKEERMSRHFCLECGSKRTSLLEMVSHSFSVCELRFLFQNVLPDLSGRVLVDVGSRLGAVLYGGFLYSSASRLVGIELSGDFVQLQNKMLHKYSMDARAQVVHADVCSQDALLQNADVVVMNNVFQYFMEVEQQIRAWKFIMQTLRKSGTLLVTVPSLHESLEPLEEALPGGWVEEIPLNYDVFVGKDADPEDLQQIHLYRIL
ncbi:uncharacterized protein LOC144206720 [Stigmatopora nigra]